MFATLYKLGEVYFLLLSTTGFHIKAKNEKFSAAGLRCGRKLIYI